MGKRKGHLFLVECPGRVCIPVCPGRVCLGRVCLGRVYIPVCLGRCIPMCLGCVCIACYASVETPDTAILVQATEDGHWVRTS